MEKETTIYGSTVTSSGVIKHIDAFGFSCPVAIEISNGKAVTDSRGCPVAVRDMDSFVFVLPGGSRFTHKAAK